MVRLAREEIRGKEESQRRQMMGCDYYADENGEFELEVIDYKTGMKLGIISIKLDADHPISLDLIKGKER